MVLCIGMSNRFFVISGALLLIIFIAAVFFLFSGDGENGEVSVHLRSHDETAAGTDSDGDGTPDWLEDITGFDSFNATSFPYQKDVVDANSITIDDLLYDGPGGITEEITRRILLSDPGAASVTPEEEEEFAAASARYFLGEIEKRGFPSVSVGIDDSVSRSDVLHQFVSALGRFNGVAESGIETLIFEVFAKNTAMFENARAMHDTCRLVLKELPRSVPSDAYDSYYLVVERITYLCESLSVALNDPSPENFFYFLKLASSGELFRRSADSEADSGRSAQDMFTHAVYSVIQILQE